MNKIRIAFAGFRHGHIFDIVAAAQADPELEIVAACEEDAATRADLAKSGKVAITHQSIDRMLADMPCDVVAVGDYYAKRGSIVLRALSAGRHVISDKPLCTRLDELDRIEELARAKGLAVGLQLDLRGNGVALAAKKALGAGALGQVHTVAFSGQHPLMWGVRPSWYFQEGCHGGTINDLFIHAADGVEWLTGRQIAGVVAARAWNANLPQCPSFQVGAQVMLRLDNDGGAIGDVSYLAPTKAGYSVPSYWRFLIHGDKGEMEFGITGSVVRLTTHDDAATREIPAEPKISAVYLKDFLAEVKGESREGMLATPQVLRASRIALEAQQAADK